MIALQKIFFSAFFVVEKLLFMCGTVMQRCGRIEIVSQLIWKMSHQSDQKTVSNPEK